MPVWILIFVLGFFCSLCLLLTVHVIVYILLSCHYRVVEALYSQNISDTYVLPFIRRFP